VAITIDWGNTYVISVPQADLTFLGGTLYEHDVDAFRLALKALEDGEEGIPFPDTHIHNTEVTISGIIYARTIQIISPYTVTYEDLSYRVNLIGANNNITDVLNLNKVQVIPSNSAGLQSPNLAVGVWDELTSVVRVAGGYGQLIKDRIDAAIASRAAPGAAMVLTSAAELALATAVLNFDIGNGRTLKDAVASSRNKWRITGSVNPFLFECFDSDDSTLLWSANITLDPITGAVREMDPV